MAFDMSNYETVAQLNKWFQENYPMGRIRVEIISDDPKEERMSVWAAIYRDSNDNHPCVENIARGRQSDYPRPMQRFYAEDLATSAIGRCITLLKGGNTATADDMKKVESAPIKSNNDWESFVAEKPKPVKEADAWSTAVGALQESLGAEVIESIPNCAHGEMILKEGTNKMGKPYRGYVCRRNDPANKKCAIWYNLTPQGTWVPQEPRDK
jgi:hypothetical protein